MPKGLSWVISWTDIELVRLPTKGEKVILRIWPGKNKVNLYSRSLCDVHRSRRTINGDIITIFADGSG